MSQCLSTISFTVCGLEGEILVQVTITIKFILFFSFFFFGCFCKDKMFVLQGSKLAQLISCHTNAFTSLRLADGALDLLRDEVSVFMQEQSP